MSRFLQAAVEPHCRFVEQMLDHHLLQFSKLPEDSPVRELVDRTRHYIEGIRNAAENGNAELVLTLLQGLEWLELLIFEASIKR